MRRALAVLSMGLLATAAGAATTTPVGLLVLDPPEVLVETFRESELVDSQVLSGTTVDWFAAPPLAGGSARFEFDVSSGRIAIASTGSITAPTDIGLLEYEVKATLLPDPTRVQIDVPDFGESMTTIAIVGEGSLDLSRTGDRKAWARANSSASSYSSSLLARSVRLTHSSSVSVNGEILIGEPGPLSISGPGQFAELHSFPAGDTAVLDLPMEFRAGCNTLSGTSTACSVTWDATAEIELVAIVPEAHNRPMTQCFDGIDNDLDGAIDLADGNCSDPWDTTEMPPPIPSGCGIGPELALGMPLLLWLRRRASA